MEPQRPPDGLDVQQSVELEPRRSECSTEELSRGLEVFRDRSITEREEQLDAGHYSGAVTMGL